MIKMQEIRSTTINDYDTMRDIQDIVRLIEPTSVVATVNAINLDGEGDMIGGERYFLAIGTKAELKITKNTINKIEGILESDSHEEMFGRVELIDITLLK